MSAGTNDQARITSPAAVAGAPAIVIGAGPVGLYAAFQLGLNGFRPVLLDAMGRPGGQCAALYPEGVIHDAPGLPGIAAGEFAERLSAQLAPFHPLFLFGRRATALWGTLEGGFNVETNTGETITGATVIHAGGIGALRPKRPVAEGIETLGAQDLSFDEETPAVGRRVAVLGEGAAAVDAALAASGQAKSVTLIHALPLRADAERLTKLREAAEAERIAITRGELARVHARDGRLSGLELNAEDGVHAYDIDLLLVRAGLEIASGGLTGLGEVATEATGETGAPGVFIVGDARLEEGRPPVLAAGFAEALRAAEAARRRVTPKAPRALPHTASSPTLRARLDIA